MGQKSILISIVIIIFAVIFVVLFILSRATQQTRNQREVKETTASKNLTGAMDVISDPLVYDGLTLEIEAPINDWITKRVFSVSANQPGLLGIRRQLLVVSKSTFQLPVKTTGTEVGLGETVNVRLKGRVRIMDRVELGRAIGLDLDGSDIRLDDNNIAGWDEGSVFLLTSVEKI